MGKERNPLVRFSVIAVFLILAIFVLDGHLGKFVGTITGTVDTVTETLPTTDLSSVQRSSLAVVGNLVFNIHEGESPLETSVILAKSAAETRLKTQDIEVPNLNPEKHNNPSAAALTLFANVQATATEEQKQQLARLDALPEPTRGALSDLLDAFSAYQKTTITAVSAVDLNALQNPPAMDLNAANLDIASVVAARNDLLDSVVGFEKAVGTTPSSALEDLRVDGCVVVPVVGVPNLPAIPPIGAPEASPATREICIFTLDFTETNNTYDKNYSLIVDTSGWDVYHGNAGGGSITPSSCSSIPVYVTDITKNVDTLTGAVGAVIDLKGNDRYEGSRGCAVNGGGRLGAGLIIDVAGNDVYTGPSNGVNGGAASGGIGFLLDVTGDDVYTASAKGTNGGSSYGSGFLLDLSGNDRYVAAGSGTNGGADAGSGLLVDIEGDDSYTAGESATNGGSFGGSGFLFDRSGNDKYVAGNSGTNGGARLGVGVLFDEAGKDRYTSGSDATNGGASLGGLGMLIDAEGDDSYTAGNDGTNGGSISAGSGLLFDNDGADSYTAGSSGTNGGAGPGVGFLVDSFGQDKYVDSLGSCANPASCTVVPKEISGVQLDVEGSVHSGPLLNNEFEAGLPTEGIIGLANPEPWLYICTSQTLDELIGIVENLAGVVNIPPIYPVCQYTNENLHAVFWRHSAAATFGDFDPTGLYTVANELEVKITPGTTEPSTWLGENWITGQTFATPGGINHNLWQGPVNTFQTYVADFDALVFRVESGQVPSSAYVQIAINRTGVNTTGGVVPIEPFDDLIDPGAPGLAYADCMLTFDSSLLVPNADGWVSVDPALAQLSPVTTACSQAKEDWDAVSDSEARHRILERFKISDFSLWKFNTGQVPVVIDGIQLAGGRTLAQALVDPTHGSLTLDGVRSNGEGYLLSVQDSSPEQTGAPHLNVYTTCDDDFAYWYVERTDEGASLTRAALLFDIHFNDHWERILGDRKVLVGESDVVTDDYIINAGSVGRVVWNGKSGEIRVDKAYAGISSFTYDVWDTNGNHNTGWGTTTNADAEGFITSPCAPSLIE